MNLLKRLIDAVNQGVIIAGEHKRTEGQVLIAQLQKAFNRDPWEVAAEIERLCKDWDRQDSEYLSAISELPDSDRCAATEKNTLDKIRIRRTAALMDAIYGTTEKQ